MANGRSCKICHKGGCNSYLELQSSNIKIIVYVCEDCKQPGYEQKIIDKIRREYEENLPKVR